MGFYDIIHRATNFGTTCSRENFLSFTLKIIFYIIPAVLLGFYTDRLVRRLREEKRYGSHIISYILLQTLIDITTLYLLLLLVSSYMGEFQTTIAGSYFIVLYFGIQMNYIHMIHMYIRSFE
jgi:hypothetical protein